MTLFDIQVQFFSFDTGAVNENNLISLFCKVPFFSCKTKKIDSAHLIYYFFKSALSEKRKVLYLQAQTFENWRGSFPKDRD